jgi:hypothetical protein
VRRLEDLIVALAEELPCEAGGPELGVRVAATELDLDLPIEAFMSDQAECLASLPRGRFASGFTPPHGRVRIQLRRPEP